VDCMGNPKSALSDIAARRSSTIKRDIGASVAVCRVAEGGDEDEMIDRLGCHWTDGDCSLVLRRWTGRAGA
jgi:hypothetical protein